MRSDAPSAEARASTEAATETVSRSSPCVLRVAAVLNFMAEHPREAFSLSDLVRGVNLSRATAHALLTGLTEVGYLYRTARKTYVLGPGLSALGARAGLYAGREFAADSPPNAAPLGRGRRAG